MAGPGGGGGTSFASLVGSEPPGDLALHTSGQPMPAGQGPGLFGEEDGARPLLPRRRKGLPNCILGEWHSGDNEGPRGPLRAAGDQR